MRYNVEDLEKRIQKNKNRKKILSTIIYIILVVFLIINTIFVMQTIVNSQKVPSIFGYKSFSIVTRKHGTNYKS